MHPLEHVYIITYEPQRGVFKQIVLSGVNSLVELNEYIIQNNINQVRSCLEVKNDEVTKH